MDNKCVVCFFFFTFFFSLLLLFSSVKLAIDLERFVIDL